METGNERVLAVSESQDAVMEEEIDVKSFIGSMERKGKKLLTARKRVEELRDERHLRSALSEYWDD
jgi:hypothetical protein